MKVIGTVADQKPTGEDGNHHVGCRTAMWKERRNHHIMISKQQPKYYDQWEKLKHAITTGTK